MRTMSRILTLTYTQTQRSLSENGQDSASRKIVRHNKNSQRKAGTYPAFSEPALHAARSSSVHSRRKRSDFHNIIRIPLQPL